MSYDSYLKRIAIKKDYSILSEEEMYNIVHSKEGYLNADIFGIIKYCSEELLDDIIKIYDGSLSIRIDVIERGFERHLKYFYFKEYDDSDKEKLVKCKVIEICSLEFLWELIDICDNGHFLNRMVSRIPEEDIFKLYDKLIDKPSWLLKPCIMTLGKMLPMDKRLELANKDIEYASIIANILDEVSIKVLIDKYFLPTSPYVKDRKLVNKMIIHCSENDLNDFLYLDDIPLLCELVKRENYEINKEIYNRTHSKLKVNPKIEELLYHIACVGHLTDKLVTLKNKRIDSGIIESKRYDFYPIIIERYRIEKFSTHIDIDYVNIERYLSIHGNSEHLHELKNSKDSTVLSNLCRYANHNTVSYLIKNRLHHLDSRSIESIINRGDNILISEILEESKSLSNIQLEKIVENNYKPHLLKILDKATIPMNRFISNVVLKILMKRDIDYFIKVIETNSPLPIEMYLNYLSTYPNRSDMDIMNLIKEFIDKNNHEYLSVLFDEVLTKINILEIIRYT